MGVKLKLLLYLLVALILITIGYFWGRSIGRKEGFKESFFWTRLYLRQQSLVQGRCQICDTSLDDFYSQQEKDT